MGSDTSAPAPYPGTPVGADLYGRTLTIYYPQDPATGRYPTVTVTSTTAWTAKGVRQALHEHGVAAPELRALTTTTRARDAYVTSAAGVLAIAERVTAGTHRVARFVALAAAVRATGRPA